MRRRDQPAQAQRLGQPPLARLRLAQGRDRPRRMKGRATSALTNAVTGRASATGSAIGNRIRNSPVPMTSGETEIDSAPASRPTRAPAQQTARWAAPGRWPSAVEHNATTIDRSAAARPGRQPQDRGHPFSSTATSGSIRNRPRATIAHHPRPARRNRIARPGHRRPVQARAHLAAPHQAEREPPAATQIAAWIRPSIAARPRSNSKRNAW
jgi:hypothetical protein